MNNERELTLIEIAQLQGEERLAALRHRIATKEYEERDTEYEHAPIADRQVLHLFLSEEEIALLYQLLDEKERYARSIIKRNEDYPTYNAKAIRSNEKQEALIRKIESIRTQITDQ